MDADDAGRPSGYEICLCCGTQFGKDDFDMTWDYGVESEEQGWLLLRKAWIDSGAPWRSPTHPAPVGWDPNAQLERAFGAPAHKLSPPGSE
jgi:hypothetical protein